MERGRGDGALEVGDVLIRVGDTDLRGVGYLGFDAIALAEAGTSLETSVVFERGGDRRSASLTMLSSGLSFYRVVPVLSWVLVVTLILVRRRGANDSGSRLLFAATLCVALLTTPFFGGPRWQSYVSLSVFHAVGGIAFILSLRWALQFPDEMPTRARLSPHWCWLGGLWWIVRIGYFQPALLPPGVTPRLSLGFDLLFILGMLAVVTHNYVHAGPIGRRRVTGLDGHSHPMVVGRGMSDVLHLLWWLARWPTWRPSGSWARTRRRAGTSGRWRWSPTRCWPADVPSQGRARHASRWTSCRAR